MNIDATPVIDGDPACPDCRELGHMCRECWQQFDTSEEARGER